MLFCKRVKSCACVGDGVELSSTKDQSGLGDFFCFFATVSLLETSVDHIFDK
jgi:hypothetical protein